MSAPIQHHAWHRSRRREWSRPFLDRTDLASEVSRLRNPTTAKGMLAEKSYVLMFGSCLMLVEEVEAQHMANLTQLWLCFWKVGRMLE